MRLLVLILSLLPLPAFADGLKVENAVVPPAPPGARAHAAYFSLTNEAEGTRYLVGVSADGYSMAHIHKSEVMDDIATMSAVEIVELAPRQRVDFEPGGLHVMLMTPSAPLAQGDTVDLSLRFANGEVVTVTARVMPVDARGVHGS